MGQRFDTLTEKHIEFMARQKMFFVGTAGPEGRVNISPKAFETFRVVDERRVIWLNLSGSGNETAAHVQQAGRMTIMFCAFEGSPVILRLYGTARVIHPTDSEWATTVNSFGDHPAPRQAFVLDIDLVQKSCGFTVPFMEFQGDRDTLHKWAATKEPDGIEAYWREKNTVSLDGAPIDMPATL